MHELPICQGIVDAAEVRGVDPLYVANEGKLVAIVGPEEAGRVVERMRPSPVQ